MNIDKRIEKNKKNIENLKLYLQSIISNPVINISDDLIKSLKSQGGLSKIENEEFGVVKSSINTLKRVSPLIFNNGFDSLEKLRTEAYNALLNCENIPNLNKIKKMDKSKKIEEELNSSIKHQLLMTKLISDNLTALNSIEKNINNKKQLESIVKEAKSKLIYFISNNEMKPDNILDFNGDKNGK